jgi:hypothetical protein
MNDPAITAAEKQAVEAALDRAGRRWSSVAAYKAAMLRDIAAQCASEHETGIITENPHKMQ